MSERSATLFTDPVAAKPRLWILPLRAFWPVVLAAVVAGLVFSLVLPHINLYQQLNLSDCGVAIILAVSLTVVNGFTGQFSIGHSGFMAIGGFAAASLMYYGSYHWFGDTDFHGGLLSWTLDASRFHGPLLARGDWLFFGSIIAGAVLAAAVGWIVGLPSLRLRGDYLAIVTLGFCEIVRIIIQSSPPKLETRDPDDPYATGQFLGDTSIWKELHHLGGPVGFNGAPRYSSVFWILLAVIITLALTIRLKYSSYGRAMLSIREDEIAAQAVGVNITRLKVRAFVYSAFFAGLGGGLAALHNGTIAAADMGFLKSFDFVIMVVLGGLGSISGATLAAILLTFLPQWLLDLPTGQKGLAILACAALATSGMARSWLLAVVTLIGYLLMMRYTRDHGFNPSDYRLVIYSIMLIATMILRPQGLFGVHEIWDYIPTRWRWWIGNNEHGA